MPNPRNLANMSPEQIEEKVEALSPAWAREYIRRLEGLTRALAAQLQAAQVMDGGLTQDNMVQMAGNGEAPAANRDTAIALSALARIWEAGYMDVGLSADETGAIERVCAAWLSGEPPASGDSPVPAAGTFSNGVAPVLPSVWTPAGITPPDSEYATVRVLDGQANMEPVADLPDKAEIRFADFYQVRYGGHETTGGMRLLVVEADGPIQVRPVSQATVLIARGEYSNQEQG